MLNIILKNYAKKKLSRLFDNSAFLSKQIISFVFLVYLLYLSNFELLITIIKI